MSFATRGPAFFYTEPIHCLAEGAGGRMHAHGLTGGDHAYDDARVESRIVVWADVGGGRAAA